MSCSFRRYIIFCGFAMMLCLSACSTLLMETGAGSKSQSSLMNSSYGAADMLIQQSRHFISTKTPLELGAIIDLDSPNERTNFGQIAGEQIASRFVQLGYSVTSLPYGGMQPENKNLSSGTTMQPYDGGGEYTGRAIITGQYAVARDEIFVNLRLIGADNNKLLAAYDYIVPKTGNVRELVKTKADKESLFGL